MYRGRVQENPTINYPEYIKIKIEEYKKENELLKKELEDTLAKNQSDMEALKGALGVVCSNSRNKQVKEAYKALEEKDGNEGN